MHEHFSETSGHQRLLYAAAAGLLMGLLPLPIAWQMRALLGWSCGAGTYIVLSWMLAFHFDAASTREHAQAQDQPGLLLFLLLFLSVFASIAAIAFMLQHVKDLSAAERMGHLALSMLALGASWLLMQTIFAFRYAHVFYQEQLADPQSDGGLQFPGNLPPDYYDFLYYAHVVGMTSQVSDVVITSRTMRHLTLLHSISAFGFNMLVLALSINVMAGGCPAFMTGLAGVAKLELHSWDGYCALGTRGITPCFVANDGLIYERHDSARQIDFGIWRAGDDGVAGRRHGGKDAERCE